MVATLISPARLLVREFGNEQLLLRVLQSAVVAGLAFPGWDRYGHRLF